MVDNLFNVLENYDYNNILDSSEVEDDFFKNVDAYCDELKLKVEQITQHSQITSSNIAEKQEHQLESVSQLTCEKKELKKKIEEARLQIKIVDKQLTKVVKLSKILDEELTNSKEEKEKLTLELVDLEQDSQKSKDAIIKMWVSLREAMAFYKIPLEMHIDTDMQRPEHITIELFYGNNPTDYVCRITLITDGYCWKVHLLEPILKDYDFNFYINPNQFQRGAQIENIPLLLYEWRRYFKTKYIDRLHS